MQQQQQSDAALAELQDADGHQPLDPRKRKTGGSQPPPDTAVEAAAVRPPPPPPPPPIAPPAGPGLPTPLPTNLSAAQVHSMRHAAVGRILGATKNKPIRNFRELLLSRLVSQAPQADGLADLLLQHVLTDYHGSRGHVLVVRWLYALALSLAAEQQEQRGKGESSSSTAAPVGSSRHTRGTKKKSAKAASAKSAPAAASEQQREGQQQQDQPAQEAAAEDVVMQEADSTSGVSAAAAATAAEEMQQEFPNGEQGGRSAALCHLDLSGTAYESALVATLTGLQSQLDASDPAIPRLLQEVPVLPVMAVLGFLRQLLAAGADWVSVGLNSALLLIESRPPLRQQLLHLILEAAVAADGLTRQKAIALVVSKLMGWEEFADSIIRYAQEQLLLLLEPQKLMQQQQQPELSPQPAAPAQPEAQQQQQQQQASQTEQPEQQQQQQQQGMPPGQHQQQQLSQANGAAGHEDTQQQVQEPPAPVAAADVTLTVEVAAQQCMLFMSLCALRPPLMVVLLETYGKAGEDLGRCPWGGGEGAAAPQGWACSYATHTYYTLHGLQCFIWVVDCASPGAGCCLAGIMSSSRATG
jgi:hypothetical protein